MGIWPAYAINVYLCVEKHDVSAKTQTIATTHIIQ